MKLRYAVLFYETPNGYWMQTPDLPGCFSAGDDLDDARRMVKEAMVGWLEVTVEHGEPIPEMTLTTDQALEWDAAQRQDEELLELMGDEPDDTISIHAEMIEVEAPVAQTAAR